MNVASRASLVFPPQALPSSTRNCEGSRKSGRQLSASGVTKVEQIQRRLRAISIGSRRTRTESRGIREP